MTRTSKEMKTYTLAEMKDEFVGKPGTKEREEYELEVAEAVRPRGNEQEIKLNF